MTNQWIGLYVGGPDGGIDAHALADGAAALVRLLEKSATNLKVKGPRRPAPRWVVNQLSTGSLDIKLAPGNVATDEGANALSSLADGIKALDDEPNMPDNWDRGMLLDVQRLGAVGQLPGVRGVWIDGPGINSIHLEDSVLKHVEQILNRTLTSIGSVTGQVVSWRVARDVDHVEILDEVSGEKVDIEVPSAAIAKVEDIIRKRVRASGYVRRNLDGVKIDVSATEIEVLDKRPRMSIWNVRNDIGGDWTGGIDPVTWQRRLRDIG